MATTAAAAAPYDQIAMHGVSLSARTTRYSNHLCNSASQHLQTTALTIIIARNDRHALVSRAVNLPQLSSAAACVELSPFS